MAGAIWGGRESRGVLALFFVGPHSIRLLPFVTNNKQKYPCFLLFPLIATQDDRSKKNNTGQVEQRQLQKKEQDHLKNLRTVSPTRPGPTLIIFFLSQKTCPLFGTKKKKTLKYEWVKSIGWARK
jgi:hypothetical protein